MRISANGISSRIRRARARSGRSRRRGGPALRLHALFETLQESLHRADPDVWGWPAWPPEFRDPASAAVAGFADAQLERIELYEYLQWQAETQLAAAADHARSLELGVGLYQDLAVSIDRGGAEAWANQDLYVVAASIGAPPDAYNLKGQNWGLPPLNPERLRAAAYAPFVAMLRANMRHAGALRIDHAMGLARLYWVPPSGAAADGAYVSYPLDDLLGIVALESVRNCCMVIGEDLGTVPPELRTALAARGVLSYRVLPFERDANGGFAPPDAYPAEALVAATTHDLPTIAGFWDGRDLAVRRSLGLLPDEGARQAALIERAQDRARLLLALERERLLPPGATADPASIPAATPELARAVHAYLARTPSRILVVQLEDLLGVHDPVNLPGTSEAEQPNWRRKLPVALERFGDDPRFDELVRTLAALRPLPRTVARRAPPGDASAPRATVRIPRATYRVQLHRDFTFADAARIAPYLARLGVSHLYCSPILRARPGSTHGYDIVDHREINPELGGQAGFDSLADTLQAHGLGLVVDVVPNHMGVMGADNAWWLDVLENGPAAEHAAFFDIDWHPLDASMANRVLLPVLGEHYGLVLERGDLRLEFDAGAGALSVSYFEHRFPVDPREYPRVLALAASEPLPDQPAAELASVAAAFGHLPARDDTRPDALAERRRDKSIHQRRLAALVAASPEAAAAIERAVQLVNGTPAERESFARLHELLEAQAYRLAFWRVASDEINYRRFFDINDLAALRMEHEGVFEATHALMLDLAAAGRIDGLRIDHPDGLYDPAQYFDRLQQGYAHRVGVPLAPVNGSRPARPVWVVAEKIVAGHERLPESWRVHGTTGYRFAAVVNGLFVDPGARSRFERLWHSFTGETSDAAEAAYQGRRVILKTALASELTVLSSELLRLARADRRTRDYTFNTLRQALAEVVACFPVYRTYLRQHEPRADSSPVERRAIASRQDRRFIDWAVARARRRSRAADVTIFEFVRSALLGRAPDDAHPAIAERFVAFALKFQQFSGPVNAKGVEDTAYYRYTPLASLNEVGTDPGMFGISVAAFHGASADRAATWPHTVVASSTHDSKRSEDVRARIDVLSEMPGAWRLMLRRWSRVNRSKKRLREGAPAPTRADEYLLYQTLLGTFPARLDAAGLPAYRERIERYMLKAVREAKLHSSWVNLNDEYESTVRGFIEGLLGRAEGNRFLDDLREQAGRIEWFGLLNSLSMTLLKVASPGVPDIYQGTDALDLSLVDPDNRRPVDYASRERLLDSLAALAAGPQDSIADGLRALFDDPWDGRGKLWILWRALGLRREDPTLFEQGSYTPLAVTGARASHVVAFARQHAGRALIAVSGRLFLTLLGDGARLPLGPDVWGDTAIDLAPLGAATDLVNGLTGERLDAPGGRLAMADAFSSFPGALILVRGAA